MWIEQQNTWDTDKTNTKEANRYRSKYRVEKMETNKVRQYKTTNFRFAV